MLPEFLTFLLVFAAVGAVAGYLAGLLGIGGGLIMVPAIAAWLGDAPQAMQVAVGTSLATIVISSSSSLWAHQRHGAIVWPRVAALAPGLVAGAALGALLAASLSSAGLGACFGIFCLLAGGRMLRGAQRSTQGSGASGAVELGAAGVVIGTISAIVGIGGGTLSVPYLNARGLDMHRAVATSAACGLPIAIAGMAGFMLLGQDSAVASEIGVGPLLGFVWLPAVAVLGVVSALLAPLGARHAHRSGQAALKRVFGLFLLTLGGYFVARLLL